MAEGNRILLDDALGPAQGFFNIMDSYTFMEVLEAFAKGHGAGAHDSDCKLPLSIAEEERVPVDSIDYVEFWARWYTPQELRVSIPRFLELLREAATAEARMRPERAGRIAELVEATARTLQSPGRAPQVDGGG